MKTFRFRQLVKNILLTIAGVSMIFSLSSCAKKITFITSSVVPAATGFVKIQRDKNSNYVIKIQLSNLAESNRLTPPKKTYIVWLVSNNNVTKNIGQIKSGSGMLSKSLKASFETVSSVKPAKIFITVENEESTQYPDTQVVLSTDFF